MIYLIKRRIRRNKRQIIIGLIANYKNIIINYSKKRERKGTRLIGGYKLGRIFRIHCNNCFICLMNQDLTREEEK